MNEFTLIKTYFNDVGLKAFAQQVECNNVENQNFAKSTISQADNNINDGSKLHKVVNENCVQLGIGDDCALLKVPLGASMAVSTDSFLEGHHFFAGTPAEAIGYKALAVNLSDLAAMGAEPIGFTLALTLPKADPQFLAGFVAGLKMAAERYPIPLIGGDTTRGPLSVTITVFGAVLPTQAFRRSAANPGDYVCVTGPLGGAALAVKERMEANKANAPWPDASLGTPGFALDYPVPRFDVAQALKSVNCRVALDISDGLKGDLQHILIQSKCAAIIDWADIPVAPALKSSKLSSHEIMKLVLEGGDDYELCLTLSPKNYEAYLALMTKGAPKIYKIGQIVAPDTALDKSSTLNKAELGHLYMVKDEGLNDITGSGFSHF